MNRFAALLVFLALTTIPVRAEQSTSFEYFDANRTMINNGVQAVLMCNGLFTSNRSVDQVFAQELAYVRNLVGTPNGGDYVVDRKLQAVAIGGGDSGPVIRAAFREGIGCVVMSPDQSFDDIDSLPEFERPIGSSDAAATRS